MPDGPFTDNGDDADFCQLLIQVKAGERPIDALFESRAYKRIVPTICRVHTYNHEDAKDLYSEVNMRVFGGFSTFTPDFTKPYGKFFGWVRRIARNKFIDDVRRERLNYANQRPDELLDLVDDKESIETAYERRERDERLQRFIARLDPRDRKIMEYHHFEENSLRTISARLAEDGIECSHVTVQTSLRRLYARFFDEEDAFAVRRKPDQPSGPRERGGTPSAQKTGS